MGQQLVITAIAQCSPSDQLWDTPIGLALLKLQIKTVAPVLRDVGNLRQAVQQRRLASEKKRGE